MGDQSAIKTDFVGESKRYKCYFSGLLRLVFITKAPLASPRAASNTAWFRACMVLQSESPLNNMLAPSPL